MAGPKGSAAPASVAEGLNGIAQAVTAAMTTPDAAPLMRELMQMQGTVIGMIHKTAGGGGAGPPGAAGAPPAGGAPPGAPGSPNFGISALGGGPQGPSAATAGGGPGSGLGSAGMDADAIRQLTASSA